MSFESRHGRVLVLALLFLAALGIRLHRVDEPPLNFHAVRQYHSLLIARGYYLETQRSVPEWKRQVARASQERRGLWEPHLMESAVAAAYRLAGGEHVWIPRVLSSLAWLIGGGFVYLIARRMTDADAAVFCTGVYLFLPFAVVASRSFQPDPLMVSALIASVFAVQRYYERPSPAGLVLAAALAALAIVIKFVALFAIVAAFAFVGIHTQGLRKTATSRRTLLFLAIALLPPFMFYFHQMFISRSLLGVARNDLLPQLLIDPAFWKGWLQQIDAVVGYPLWMAGLVGLLLSRERATRGLLLGLWVGYVLFGLVFTYTVHTHDYWNLQLVPIVALSLAPLAALVLRRLLTAEEPWPQRAAVGGLGILAVGLSVGIVRGRLHYPDWERKVGISKEIGERVEHSTDVVYLSGDYGLPLEYHGFLSGFPWPLSSDLEWERLAGVPSPEAADRFRAKFADRAPRYFVVEDLRELALQPDLERFLSRFDVVAQTEDYVVFALARR